MIPLEFVVDGIPVSAQTRNRSRLEAWRNTVATEARKKIASGISPTALEVSIEIVFFYRDEAGDVDNIIKPIQDALNGVVYIDDKQVGKTSSKKSKLDGKYRILGVSTEVVTRIAEGKEFIWVRVLPAPDHEELL